MRFPALRALLIALAMVVQTLAGASGLARAAETGAAAVVSSHCADRAGDANGPGQGPHAHHCQHCCLCANGATDMVVVDWQALPTVAFQPAAYVAIDGRARALATTPTLGARGPPAV
jgi:hypothetical protein